MKKALKKMGALLLSGAMALSMAACGGAASTASSTAAPAATTDTAAASAATSSEPVTLTMSWWGGDSRHEATMKAVDAFMEKYPNIKVEVLYGAWGGWLEQQTVAMAGGTESDVMQINWNWIYMFSPTGDGFMDLNQYSDTIDLTQYDQSLLDQMTIDGKLQGIPFSTTGKVFIWNKTTFDQAGVAVPTSFEDMITAGHAFKEKLGDDYYPLALTPYEEMLVMVYYLQQKYDKQWIVDGVVNFSEAEVAEGLDFIKMLEDEHVLAPQEKINADGADTMDKNSKWIDGHYAGFYEWDSSVTKFANALAEGQELVIGEFPYDYGDVKTATSKISMALAMKKDCAHPEEAALLINYLLNDPEGVEIMSTERGIVSSKAAKATLESKGMLSGLTYEANNLAVANTGFELDPYFEDTKLKEKTGLYFQVFEDMSYDGANTTELAKTLIDGITEVEEDNRAS